MQVALQLLLRLLPSIVLLVLGFLVVKDQRMATAWTDILQRTGSISAEKAEDPEIRRGIRLPFFVLSGLFLFWPILYYFRDSYAQTPVQTVDLPPVSAIKTKKGPTPTAAPTPTPDPVTRPDAGGTSSANSGGGAGMIAPRSSSDSTKPSGSGGLAPAHVN